MNRNSIVVILVTFIVVIAGGSYFYLKQQQTQAKSGLEAVPIDAAIIFQINKASSFIPKMKKNLVFDNTQLYRGAKLLGNGSKLPIRYLQKKWINQIFLVIKLFSSLFTRMPILIFTID
jgi:hypothetical protein